MIFESQQAVLGTPVDSRIKAFRAYFKSRGFVENNKKQVYIFISMPPFRNFSDFFAPKRKVILDIRDGWSIAQASGYGGNVKKKPLKAMLTRIVEWFIIRRAYLTITCTHGLQAHLQKVSGKEVLLIPNGVLDEDFVLAEKLINAQNKKNDLEELVFCCAGQFSEYGADKVKKLCNVIITRYQDKKIKIQLIGSNKGKNSWVNDYLQDKSSGRAILEVLPRMSREKLYQTMVKADFGLSILRDPDYDFGTKIYDYIALDLPVVNYFDKPNNFTQYFDACLDVPFNKQTAPPEIRRSYLIKRALDNKEFMK